jgi:hypothetical protein
MLPKNTVIDISYFGPSLKSEKWQINLLLCLMHEVANEGSNKFDPHTNQNVASEGSNLILH